MYLGPRPWTNSSDTLFRLVALDAREKRLSRRPFSGWTRAREGQPSSASLLKTWKIVLLPDKERYVFSSAGAWEASSHVSQASGDSSSNPICIDIDAAPALTTATVPAIPAERNGTEAGASEPSASSAPRPSTSTTVITRSRRRYYVVWWSQVSVIFMVDYQPLRWSTEHRTPSRLLVRIVRTVGADRGAAASHAYGA